MPAWAPVLRPSEAGDELADAVADEDDEDVRDDVALVADPGMSVSVLTVGTLDDRTLSCAIAGAWKTSSVGALQLTLPSASSPQHAQSWADEL